MNQHLDHLAFLAAEIVPAEALLQDDTGFTIVTPEGDLHFFATGQASAYCRTRIASLNETQCPDSFAEAALRGNFFWRGTDGATISLNTAENALYLTDRFDANAFEDADAFRAYADGFMRTLFDWRARLETALEGKEAQA